MKVISAAIVVAVSLWSLVSVSIVPMQGVSTGLCALTCLLVLFFGRKGWILAMNQPE